MINYDKIPKELQSYPQWVLWNAERNTKIPYQPTGIKAASDNQATWVDFENARAAEETGAFSGIGFVFTETDPFVGIDLDDCIKEAVVDDWAKEIVLEFNSYTEVSPSGTGLKIWVKGHVEKAVKTKKIEIYPSKRYFTMTGWHVEGTPEDIRSVNGELQALADRIKPKEEPLPPVPSEVLPFTTKVPTRLYLEKWAQRKIEYAVERVSNALDGEKHNTRYAMARLLGGLIPHGLATEDSLERALFDANPPRTEAQRSERKTIRDGIREGARAPLELPEAPEQPVFNVAGVACCPKHEQMLDTARNGNGYKCRMRDSSTESGWCDFWWDGDGYIPPKAFDPETGEIIETDSVDVLLNANRSDVGNAECLIALKGDDLRFCHTRKKWLFWDGSRWCIDETGAAQRAMVDTVRARFLAAVGIPDTSQRGKFTAWCIGAENAGKVDSALRTATARPAFATTIDRWDANPFTAATKGATLDLRAVVHRSVQRDDYITMRLGANYDPETTCPRWLLFLDEIFNANVEVISFIQRAVGYCLTGSTREQKIFLCHGAGANGKSTFIKVIMDLLGDYADNASFETFDANKRNEASNDLAKLRGKRLVTVIETEEGRRLAEARVKSVTGSDMITCRFLYAEYFSYYPTYKIWLAMNHLPQIRGTDNGIWRRILLIPFSQSFIGREDKTLEETLHGELDGILQWAMEGLRQWHQRGLDPPQIVQQAVASYRNDSDQVGRWMEERCLQAPNIFLASGKGYDDYKKWCEGSGEDPMSQNKWSRRLNEKGLEPNPNKVNRGWFHIGLRVASDDTTT